MLNYEGDHYTECSKLFFFFLIKFRKRTQKLKSVLTDLGLQVCTHIQTPHAGIFPVMGLNPFLSFLFFFFNCLPSCFLLLPVLIFKILISPHFLNPMGLSLHFSSL